jgi:hypothetical protein
MNPPLVTGSGHSNFAEAALKNQLFRNVGAQREDTE